MTRRGDKGCGTLKAQSLLENGSDVDGVVVYTAFPWCMLCYVAGVLSLFLLHYAASFIHPHFQTFQIYSDPKIQHWHAHKLIKEMNQIKQDTSS